MLMLGDTCYEIDGKVSPCPASSGDYKTGTVESLRKSIGYELATVRFDEETYEIINQGGIA